MQLINLIIIISALIFIGILIFNFIIPAYKITKKVNNT